MHLHTYCEYWGYCDIGAFTGSIVADRGGSRSWLELVGAGLIACFRGGIGLFVQQFIP